MTYSIEIIKDERYILITVHGKINREAATAINAEAHALGKSNGINKYLEDLRDARNDDTVSNNYKFAYQDMKIETFDRFARVAILVDSNDHSHDFIETVSKNAGFFLSLFTDQKEAIKYLLS